MYCSKCGADVPDGMKFCTKCGTEVGASGSPEVKNTPPVKKEKAPAKPKPKRSMLIAIVTGFLCVFLVIGIVAEMAYMAVSNNINEELVDSITDVDTGFDVSTLELETSEGEMVSLYDYIEKEYDVDLEESAEITKKDLEKILSKPVVREFANELLSGYVNYVVNGEKVEPISRDTIIDFLSKNKKAIYKQLGDYVETGAFDNVEENYGEEIDDIFDKIDTDEISVSWIKKNVGVDLKEISDLYAKASWLILVVVGVLVLVILLVNIKYLLSGFSSVFVSLLAAGIIAAVCSIVVKIAYGFTDGEIVSMILEPVVTSLLIIGIIGIVIGAALLALTILIRKLFVEKRR